MNRIDNEMKNVIEDVIENIMENAIDNVIERSPFSKVSVWLSEYDLLTFVDYDKRKLGLLTGCLNSLNRTEWENKKKNRIKDYRNFFYSFVQSVEKLNIEYSILVFYSYSEKDKREEKQKKITTAHNIYNLLPVKKEDILSINLEEAVYLIIRNEKSSICIAIDVILDCITTVSLKNLKDLLFL